jgi:hypothetical protein
VPIRASERRTNVGAASRTPELVRHAYRIFPVIKCGTEWLNGTGMRGSAIFETAASDGDGRRPSE